MSKQTQMATVFPIELPADPRGSGAYKYRKAFLDGRPQDATWFAYDTTLHSRTEVEFVAFDMADSFFGGIGTEIFRFRTRVSPALTEVDVEGAIQAAANRRLLEERAAEDRRIVRSYANEIRAALATGEASR